jgi:hypothetical protein
VADPIQLGHDAAQQCELLVAVEPTSSYDEGAYTGVQYCFDFELVPSDVLVFCNENPLRFANGREPFNVRRSGEVICIGADVVAISRETSGCRLADAFVDVERR